MTNHRVIGVSEISRLSLLEIRAAAMELHLNGGGNLMLVVSIVRQQEHSQAQYVPEVVALMDFLTSLDNVATTVLGMRVIDPVALMLFTAKDAMCSADCVFSIPLHHQFHGDAFRILTAKLEATSIDEADTRRSLHFGADEALEWGIVSAIEPRYGKFSM